MDANSLIMAPEDFVQALLITLLLFALITRLFFLWFLEADEPFFKADLALYVSSLCLSAVLTGLIWGKGSSVWIHILLGFHSISPSIQTVDIIIILDRCYAKTILVSPPKFPATQSSIYQTTGTYRIGSLCCGLDNFKDSSGLCRCIGARPHLLPHLRPAFLGSRRRNGMVPVVSPARHARPEKAAYDIGPNVEQKSSLARCCYNQRFLRYGGYCAWGIFSVRRYNVMGLLTHWRSSLSFALCHQFPASPLSSEKGCRSFRQMQISLYLN